MLGYLTRLPSSARDLLKEGALSGAQQVPWLPALGQVKHGLPVCEAALQQPHDVLASQLHALSPPAKRATYSSSSATRMREDPPMRTG